MRVLLIDDSRAAQAFVRECFHGTDHHIEPALDAQDALEVLEDQGAQSFDLILLDWELPDSSGPDLIGILRDRAKDVPIVMITSHNRVDDISRMLTLGAREYIMKPFTRDILIRKIESIAV